MKKLIGITALLAAIAVLSIAAAALATMSSGVTSTTLAQGNVDDLDLKVKTGDWKLKMDAKGATTLAVSENRVAPGGHFGWHSHPGPSLVIVKSGTSTFYSGDDPDCTPHRYPAGTAYVDPGGAVHIARNEGSEELVVIVTRLIPAGAAARIDEASPGNCPF
jgi:quercetin dioxygenase-like cupin family protein